MHRDDLTALMASVIYTLTASVAAEPSDVREAVDTAEAIQREVDRRRRQRDHTGEYSDAAQARAEEESHGTE